LQIYVITVSKYFIIYLQTNKRQLQLILFIDNKETKPKNFEFYVKIHVLGIDIKLHPAVPPLPSPLGRSLSLQVQLGPLEVLVEMLMTRWWFGINTYGMPLQMPEAHQKSLVEMSRYRQKW